MQARSATTDEAAGSYGGARDGALKRARADVHPGRSLEQRTTFGIVAGDASQLTARARGLSRQLNGINSIKFGLAGSLPVHTSAQLPAHFSARHSAFETRCRAATSHRHSARPESASSARGGRGSSLLSEWWMCSWKGQGGICRSHSGSPGYSNTSDPGSVNGPVNVRCTRARVAGRLFVRLSGALIDGMGAGWMGSYCMANISRASV